MPGSINSHDFHMMGDGHQPNSRGLYTVPIIRIIPIKGGMTIPNIATFDHGTFRKFWTKKSLLIPRSRSVSHNSDDFMSDHVYYT